MRLKWIVLAAVPLLTVVPGCSASRRGYAPLNDAQSHSTVPLRESDEYAPSVEVQGDREFDSSDHDQYLTPESPIPQVPSDGLQQPSAPVEPPPAPPALGVSRVKSVSWLKDLGHRWHGDSDDCVTDESCTVGAFTPLDSCGTCEPACKSPAAGGPVLLSGVRKSFGRLLHHKPTACAEPACGSVFSEIQCAPERHQVSTPCAESGCADPEEAILQGRCTPIITNPVPSRMTPELSHETLNDDPLDVPRQLDSPLPLGPESSVPAAPMIPIPPLPEAPLAPPLTGGVNGIVQPPAWPRRPLSAPSVSHPRPAPHFVPAPERPQSDALPQIVPARRI